LIFAAVEISLGFHVEAIHQFEIALDADIKLGDSLFEFAIIKFGYC